jgi:hypothetical protein
VRKIERRLSEAHLDTVEPVCRWEWEGMFHEEVILYLHYAVVVSLGIDDHLVEDRGVDVPLLFSQPLEPIEFSTLDDLESFWYIHLDGFISPEISFGCYFFLGEAAIEQVCNRIIKIKWIHTCREEVTEYSICFHGCKDFFCQDLPLFLCVLLIEDAIGLILEADTAETKGAIL